MAPRETFWDRIAEKYAASPVRDPAAYEATLDRVRHYLKPGDAVMELGCGTGSTALILAGNTKSYLASDLSAAMLDIARGKQAESDAPNLTFRQASVQDIVPEAPFDMVIAMSLLHLLEDLDGALAAIHQQVKPGGFFISKSVCLGEMTFLIRLAIPLLRLIGKAPFVRFLTADTLEAAISDAGFEIAETAYYPQKSRARFVVARRPVD